MTEQVEATVSQAAAVAPRTYFVATTGSDDHPGTRDAPLRTIQAAADRMQAGDSVEIAAGIYRERVDPPRGGTSDETRIVYRAAPGAKVVICGSEVIQGWRQMEGDLWEVDIPDTFFGDFHPFRDKISGDWYNGRRRAFSTGCVYLDGEALTEAATGEAVTGAIVGRPLWFAEHAGDQTVVRAQFSRDPNSACAEINVRRTVFYPSAPNIDYITVSGFELRHAATPWAPPTAEQIGLIGTNWSKGWVIENNYVHDSRCSGIALGKHGDEFDNQSANTAEGYVITIERAADRGWAKDTVGSHIVRHNHVARCGQAGIVGSMGCAFSTVIGNVVHDVHLMQHFSGAEEAGIKFHGAVDTVIANNHVYRTRRGIWLDWMTQGTRVIGNLLHDNASEDLYLEVNHGPCLIANNISLSHVGFKVESTGGAFVHNLMTGLIVQRGHGRHTPYLAPHSTEVTRLGPVPIGDDRWMNNLLLGPADMVAYDWASIPIVVEDNVYGSLAVPPIEEARPLFITGTILSPRLIEEADGWYLEMMLPPEVLEAATPRLVTSERLGSIYQPRFGAAKLSAPAFELPDGSPFAIDRDYFGAPRDAQRPGVGPFAQTLSGRHKVWPLD